MILIYRELGKVQANVQNITEAIPEKQAEHYSRYCRISSVNGNTY